MEKIIGILAGMGPKSTGPFVDLVVKECQKQYGAKHDEDFPHIMIYSLPTPFFVDQPIDHTKMKRVVLGGLRKLESTGVDFICIPCNTVHAYFDYFSDMTSTPLLNIVDETLKKVGKIKEKITIFATELTMDAHVYQEGIKEKGHEFVFEESWQEDINVLIKGFKIGKNKEWLLKIWNSLVEKVKLQKVTTIIIACTDLSNLSADINVIDSTKTLAQAVVKEYIKEKH